MAEIIREINNVRTERYEINGKVFARSYGLNGCLIERDGVQYAEAIDPIEYVDERVYTETTEYIDGTDEATEQDYQEALAELGVEINEEENIEE